MSKRIYMKQLSQAVLEGLALHNAQAEARERIEQQDRERLRQQAWNMGNTTRESENVE